MAEGYLKSFDPSLDVSSAGTKPAGSVNPNSIKVMYEEGIDISKNKTNDVNEFIDKPFDFVITVCDNAKEVCPDFTGKIKNRIHLSIIDPADAKGTEEYILDEYRKVRNELKKIFKQLYLTKINK